MGWRDGATGFMGRLPGRDKEDAVEPELYTGILRQRQVPVVWRIECAT